MELSLELVVFFVLLVDALTANAFAWLGGKNKWYKKDFRLLCRWFPITKGWTTYYLVLILWLGYVMWQSGFFS